MISRWRQATSPQTPWRARGRRRALDLEDVAFRARRSRRQDALGPPALGDLLEQRPRLPRGGDSSHTRPSRPLPPLQPPPHTSLPRLPGSPRLPPPPPPLQHPAVLP